MGEISKDEQYIISESQEINLGETPDWLRKFFSAFPALKSRNYQLYFVGQVVSLVGTWLQMVAQSWLVFELTHSAIWLGIISALSSLPVLVFALFGGVIVDRFSKKKIIIITQTAYMFLAVILGVLTILKIINIYEVAVIVLLFGIVTALDMPARQAFIIEMVGREKMSSAIALNAGIFNGARIIGPAIAGVLITVVGVGSAFILNGISFLAVIAALFFVRVKEELSNIHLHPLKAIKEGIVYSANNPKIRILLSFIGLSSIFGWSFTTILPIIAQDVFHKGAVGLGYILTFFGIGAVLGTIIVSAFSKKIKAQNFIIWGSVIFGLSLILFSLSPNLTLALFFILVAGFGLILQFSTTNATVQHAVENHFRGRVMSIYTLMFMGMTTIGGAEIGYLAEHFGSQRAIIFNSIILLLFTAWLFSKRKKIF